MLPFDQLIKIEPMIFKMKDIKDRVTENLGNQNNNSLGRVRPLHQWKR